MTIEEIKKKLEEVLAPQDIDFKVVKRQEAYLQITINLDKESKAIGFFPLDFEPNIEVLAAQVKAAEAKDLSKAVFILDGSTLIPIQSIQGLRQNFRD